MRKVLRKLEIPMAGLPQSVLQVHVTFPPPTSPAFVGRLTRLTDRKEPDSPHGVFKITLIISPPKVIFKLFITSFFF